MQASVELSDNDVARIAKAVAEQLRQEPIVVKPSKPTVENTMTAKEIATKVLHVDPGAINDLVENEHLPFWPYKSTRRYIPEEVREWQIKNQRSY
ncbi:hypothetical protein [Lapidilactobacillus dextrinicus]|uniref:hypothetical protein n=1 Tax=Lapidilactobacillus dextrinicus TaxID=51664 RepID=UPI003F26C765